MLIIIFMEAKPMHISFNPGLKLFRLVSPEMEDAFAVNKYGEPINLHWGAPMNADSDYAMLLADGSIMSREGRSYNSGEYRFGAPFDFATPAIRVRFPDGAETLRLVYKSHEITSDSLIVILTDSFYPFEVKLIYKSFGDLALISRSAVITNHTDGKVLLRSAMSATLQLPRGEDYRLTHFAGAWGAEYQRQSHSQRLCLRPLVSPMRRLMPYLSLRWMREDIQLKNPARYISVHCSTAEISGSLLKYSIRPR